MKIELWSDFTCPYCVVGKAQLKEALKEFKDEPIEVIYRSYELDPDGEGVDGETAVEAMMKSYGITREKAERNAAAVSRYAKKVGFDMKSATAISSNTLPAHRLAKFARDKGKGEEMMDALYKANFTDNKLLSDEEVLLDLARSLGLDETEVKDLLAGQDYLEEVRADEALAEELKIDLIPAFRFGESTLLTNTQSPETFRKEIGEALAREKEQG